MLLRSDYFTAMFSSSFKEAQDTEYLQIIPIDCSPQVLEIVLTYLYTERADFQLETATEVLFAADLLFLERLKVKAATTISTLGNGTASIVEAENPRGETEVEDLIDIYDVVRAGWITRVHRLEEFGARYLAYRLERYIDQDEFMELVKESAARIKERQETDTIELIDDIRFYLSERYRLRFEDIGLEEVMDESDAVAAVQAAEDAERVNTETPPKVKQEDLLESKQSEVLGAQDVEHHLQGGVIRTLDGEIAGDEFAQDSMNFQILMGKIDSLLEKLNLDA